MSHTPAPWDAVDDDILAGDEPIAFMPLLDGVNPTEWQANLRLVAAAPELLAALKAMVARFYREGGTVLTAAEVVLAEAAIAKAEWQA